MDLPADNMDEVKIDPINEHIELRFTIPSITNKIQVMNELYLLTAKQKNKNLDKNRNKQLASCSNFESDMGSKAIPSQYYHKKDVVNDVTANAVRHHTGSHYVMAGGVQFQRGCRVKGVVSRHSHQAAVRNGKNNKHNK
jgi:hypothetical protein